MTIIHSLDPPAFAFVDPKGMCAYWSDGKHIVANGECRCGQKFMLARVVRDEADEAGCDRVQR